MTPHPFGTFTKGTAMKTAKAVMSFVKRALKDERGGEVLEYVLVVGIISVIAIAAIAAYGRNVLGRWMNFNNSF